MSLRAGQCHYALSLPGFESGLELAEVVGDGSLETAAEDRRDHADSALGVGRQLPAVTDEELGVLSALLAPSLAAPVVSDHLGRMPLEL